VRKLSDLQAFLTTSKPCKDVWQLLSFESLEAHKRRKIRFCHF